VQARVGSAAEGSAATENQDEPAANTATSEVPMKRTSRLAPVASRSMRAVSSVHVRFGGHASTTSGVGPGVAFGPGAFAALELGRARFGLGADAFSARNVHVRLGRADFRLLSGRLEACPWSLPLSAWATAEPCAMGELGSFWVAPHVNPPAVTVSEPKAIAWGALGAFGRLVLRFQPFVVAIELIGRVPLRREHFYVGSREQIVFRIPPLSAGASVGLGLRF